MSINSSMIHIPMRLLTLLSSKSRIICIIIFLLSLHSFPTFFISINHFAPKVRIYRTDQFLLNFVVGTDQQLSKQKSVELRNVYLAYNATCFVRKMTNLFWHTNETSDDDDDDDDDDDPSLTSLFLSESLSILAYCTIFA
jgi:hypothetical protein